MEGFYEVLKSLWVLWLMALFLGIVAWVMWPRRKQQFDAQARIPLEDELPDTQRKKG